MTSGRPPPLAAVRRRAGVLVPPAVAAAVRVPSFLVFVGATVLLSVVLGAGAGGPAPDGAVAPARPRRRRGRPQGRPGARWRPTVGVPSPAPMVGSCAVFPGSCGSRRLPDAGHHLADRGHRRVVGVVV